MTEVTVPAQRQTGPPSGPCCPACSKPSKDGALCQGDESCTAQLEQALGDVPALAVAAATGYSGQARITRLPAGSQQPDPDDDMATVLKVQPIPWDEGISKTARSLHHVLVTWVRLVVEERRIPSERVAGPDCLLCTHRSCRATRVGGWPADTMPAMAGWLLAHLPWLRRHPAAAEILGSLQHATGRLEKSMDRAPELLYAGPCSADVQVADGVTRTCNHDVYAEPDTPVVQCPACRTSYDVEERRTHMASAAREYVLTATEVSRALTALSEPVTPDRIRKWAERGQLVRVGAVRRGDQIDPTYRVGDVQDLLAQAAAAAARKAAKSGKTDERKSA